ncbi:MAG: peptidylprolyl isomerase [Enterobacteriaceae bacterium]
MMETLRTAANSLVLKIIFAVIILSFILTGVGNYLVGGAMDYAVKVNGQKIPIPNFERAVENERLRQQQQYGEQFAALMSSDEYAKQIRKQVMVSMIDDTLLDQYAEKLGLAASDQMIEQNIFSVPYFQTDGKFDNDKFRALVAQMGLTPERYAQYMRQQLLTQQLVQNIAATEFVLPQELQSVASLSLQSRDVRLATLDVEKLIPEQKVSEQELQEYYQAHSKNFMTPEQVKVSYIELDADKMAQKEPVSDSDIAAYYEQNKTSYSQPAQYRYSIIQIANEKEAQKILDELHKGADFATLAKEKSEDVISKKQGGDIGWMEKGALPEEVNKAGLSHKGQLSGVIVSSLGYLIARLDDFRAEQVKPLAEVHKEIGATLSKERSLAAFYAQQQKLSDGAANDNESLATAEAAVGIKAQTTDWFDRQNVPTVLNSPQLVQAIFSGNLYDARGNAVGNSDVISIDNSHSFVMRIAGYKPEQLKSLAEVKGDITALLKRQKAESQGQKEGEKILAALNSGKGEEAMKAAGLTFGDKQTLTRDTQERMMADVVFSLPHPQAGKHTYGIATDNKNNVVLIELDAVAPGKLKADDEKGFASELLKNNSNLAIESLLSNLRESAEIKVNEELEKQ